MIKNKRTCTNCESSLNWLPTDIENAHGKVYTDETDRRWVGARCPDCYLKLKRQRDSANELKRRRSAGVPTRRNCPSPKIQRGLLSEDFAIAFILKNGIKTKKFTIQKENLQFIGQSRVNGPDLIFRDTERDFAVTVEVKSIFERHKGTTFYVKSVYPKRTEDDLIALVLDSNRVHLEDMAEHQNACSPSGCRAVTNLVREWV